MKKRQKKFRIAAAAAGLCMAAALLAGAVFLAGAEEVQTTSETKTLFYANGNTVTITRYSDGCWRDEEGVVYTGCSEDGTVWSSGSGSTLTTYDLYEAGELPEAQEVDIRNLKNTENGDITTVYKNEDGDWKDSTDTTYFLREDGLFADPDGGQWEEY